MRDIRFVAAHRGGSLEKVDHRALMGWAIVCTEHILPAAPSKLDPILVEALRIAYDWREGRATTSDAMKASRVVHALARDISDPVMKLIARCVGHAVATAHMADHCLGPAWYAWKIMELIGASPDEEKKWQEQQLSDLPSYLRELVIQSPKFQHNR